MSIREEAVVVIRLDTSGVPESSQKAATGIRQIGAAGETSARQTAAAMRQLPAQFTDVATQLAGGQNPLLILLQQGGQIKDSFGGIKPALAGIASAINPVTLAVGAAAAVVGTLGFAAYTGAQQSEQLRDTLALTGNAAGLTSTRMQALAESVANATQQTVGSSREIVLALAASGQVSNKVLASAAEAVARVADVSGQDSKKIAADFATMGQGVSKWAAEHNKAWNFISVEQYRYIRRLEEQGQVEKAMIVTNELVTKHLAGQAKNLGLLETAWGGVRKAASGAWDAMLGVGREQTTRQQLDIAMARLEALGGNLTPKAKEAAEQRIQFLKEQIKLENQQADARSQNATTNAKAIAAEEAARGKAKEYPGAIRDASGQYRNDFLRSEKEAYEGIEKARKEAMAEAAKDERESILQRFRDDKEAEKRNDQRLTAQADFIQQLVDANERATAELIADEQARGEALIAIDRAIAIRRLNAQGLTGQVRAGALSEVEEQALIGRRKLEVHIRESNDKLAAESGKANYESVRDALGAAFRDTKDPAKAFANTLGNAVYTRLTASIADAMATAAVGRDGRGGLLGDIINAIGSAGSGYTVDTGGIGVNNTGTSLPTAGGMATGTNFVPRDMIVKVHRGEKITPAKYNPDADGARASRGNFTYAPQVTIEARTDQAQVQQLVFGAIGDAQQRFIEMLKAEGHLK